MFVGSFAGFFVLFFVSVFWGPCAAVSEGGARHPSKPERVGDGFVL